MNHSRSEPLLRSNSASTAPTKSFSGKIAYVQADWHADIVQQAYLSFSAAVAESGIGSTNIDHFTVPGSLEIPLQCQMLAKTGQYDLIVAAGIIVDGGIYRHDFVASTVLDAMMEVQLKTEVPILSIVLTPHHFSGEAVHHDFFYDHFKLKGQEAAKACLMTLNNLQSIKSID